MTSAPDQLTWASLLAQWSAFAQASRALPRDADGDRWRAATTPIIELQAVTFALADLDKLTAPGERALGLDRAEIIIRKGADTLAALWRDEPLPTEVSRLIDDARAALLAARSPGVEWRLAAPELRSDHPADLVAALLAAGFEGDLYLPVPGGVLFAGSPCAFARVPGAQRPDEAHCAAVTAFLLEHVRGRTAAGAPAIEGPSNAPCLRQVYRQFDFGKGAVVRDLVLPEHAEPPPGQPQLVAAIIRGREAPVPLPIPGRADLKPVPVEFG